MTCPHQPVIMKKSRMPATSRSPSTICWRTGFPSTSSMGFGRFLVRSAMRVPLPAARITAFMTSYLCDFGLSVKPDRHVPAPIYFLKKRSKSHAAQLSVPDFGPSGLVACMGVVVELPVAVSPPMVEVGDAPAEAMILLLSLSECI